MKGIKDSSSEYQVTPGRSMAESLIGLNEQKGQASLMYRELRVPLNGNQLDRTLKQGSPFTDFQSDTHDCTTDF